MKAPRPSLLLAMLAIACAASVAHAGSSCSIDKSLFWSGISKSSKCTGANHLWANNVCWRRESAPSNWNEVCPPGCTFQANPTKCIEVKPKPWEVCITAIDSLALASESLFMFGQDLMNQTQAFFVGGLPVIDQFSGFCMDNGVNGPGFMANAHCEYHGEVSNFTGLGFFSVGVDGGSPTLVGEPNIMLSQIDVVASAPGTLVADKFVGFTGPVAKKVGKGKSTIKLGSSSSGFKMSTYAQLVASEGHFISGLVWQPSTVNATLTIKCMRGTFMPVTPTPP